MTTGQRKLHVWMWVVLAPIVLTGLTLAVLWKPDKPVQPGELPGIEAQQSELGDNGEARP